MLERRCDSRRSFGMLLPGGLPEGKRGAEWIGALARRHPQPPLFPQPLPKGGMPGTSISGQRDTCPEAESIIPRAGLPPCSAFPSVPLFSAALTLLLVIKPPANTARCFGLVTPWASRLFFFF